MPPNDLDSLKFGEWYQAVNAGKIKRWHLVLDVGAVSSGVMFTLWLVRSSLILAILDGLLVLSIAYTSVWDVKLWRKARKGKP